MIAAGSASALVRQPHPILQYQIADMAAIVDSSDTVGIADSDLYGASTAVINQTLDELQATGVTTLRIQIPWAGVEPLPGVYNWSSVDAVVNAAASRNIAILGDISSTPLYAALPGTTPLAGAPTDPSQYGAFAGLVAARYAGKVSAYEIYNEPNSVQYFQATDPAAAYTQLLKAAYPAIKAADPTATVIGGVVGAGVDFGNLTINPVTFIKNVYADGGEGYFDDLSFHPYQYTTEFSQGATLANSPLNQIAAIRQLMITNGDAAKQIWATEYGLPTNTVSTQTQATFISDFLNAYSKLSYVGPSFIYTAMDGAPGGTDPTDTFGIYNADGTPKPAQQVIAQFIATHPVTTAPVPPPVTTPPPNPAAAFAAAVAAFYQQVVKAYLTALAQALAALGTPAAVTAPTPKVTTPSTKTTAITAISLSATAPTAATPSPATAVTPNPATAAAVGSTTSTPTAQPKPEVAATVKTSTAPSVSAPAATTSLAATTPAADATAPTSTASTLHDTSVVRANAATTRTTPKTSTADSHATAKSDETGTKQGRVERPRHSKTPGALRDNG